MTRTRGKTQRCSSQDAQTRLEQAKLYHTVAAMVLDETSAEAATVVAGNAVLAAIAASDAICCALAGERWRGQDHAGAAKHLESVTGDAKLAGLLRDVVNDKDSAHYGMENVRLNSAKSAVRKAGQLIKAAEDRTR